MEYSGLAWNFWVNPNSCGHHEHYENYLRYIALTDNKTGKGKTHILLADDESYGEKRIVGFVTLRANSLIMHDGDALLGRSALEITELAVDKNYEKKGFGRTLIDMVIDIATNLNSDYIGIEYIVACVDPMAEPFYLHMEFDKIRGYENVPREGWNVGCTPMVLRLPEN